MADIIEKCERCGNETEDDYVFHCDECKIYFCDACLSGEVGQFARDISKSVWGKFCPECSDGGCVRRCGKIGHEETDEDEEEED